MGQRNSVCEHYYANIENRGVCWVCLENDKNINRQQEINKTLIRNLKLQEIDKI
jgi:hypothetical protein